MLPLIEFIRLSKIYVMGDEEVRAVDDVSMQIYEHEFTALVGASGSGKSTCMNIIGCLDVPTLGQYLLDGQDVSELTDNQQAEIRNKKLGFIFQQYNLLPKLDVMGNVEVSMAYAGVPMHERHERAAQVLERVGLESKMHHMPNQLSGGQQQRVSIARALAGRPSLILADEPTGALDSKTGREVIALLRELHSEGHTILLITHDVGIAENADRIIRLADGKIIEDTLVRPAGPPAPTEDERAERPRLNKNTLGKVARGVQPA